MPFAKLNDFDMYYEEYGKGEPVIFIHGSLSCGTETFKKQLSFFSSAYRCICADLRGHGKSRYPSLNWNTESLSEDIIELMNILGMKKAHLIGHSMGGDIALYCAVNHPERIKSIISVSSAGMVNANITAYLKQLDPESIDTVKFAGFIEKMQKLYGGQWQNFIKHTIWNCSTYPQFSENQFRKIAIPFLLIYGENDNMVLNSEIEILKSNIPLFSYRLIPDGNHFIQNSKETWEKVNCIMLDFIKNI